MHHDFEYCARVHPKQWDQQKEEEKANRGWEILAIVCAVVPLLVTVFNVTVSILGGR